MNTPPTLGIEEEYQVIDAETRALRPRGVGILHRAEATLGDAVQPELFLSQVEIATPAVATLDEARDELIKARAALVQAAKKSGSRIVAAGTHPFSHWDEQRVTPKDRYRRLAEMFGQAARELIIFGCHVHVAVPSREAGLHVMNRARVWLAPLLALSANSPFFQGRDTDYASFRTELWSRFPLAGPPLVVETLAEHDALVQSLIQAGAVKDATNLYFDMRVPEKTPTVEFRVCDVCARLDEAVLVAALCRALTQTCLADDSPPPTVRPELLRAAHWQAARDGLDGELVQVWSGDIQLVPARDALDALLAFVRPALEENGDWERATASVDEVFARGNGAARQRAIYARTGKWEEVVDALADETESA